MEQEVLLAALAGVLVLLLLAGVGAAAFLTRGAGTDKPAAPAEPQAPAGRVRGAARAAAGARRRRQQAAREAAEDEEEAEPDQPAARDAPVSRKQAYEERRRRRDEEREAAAAAEEAAAERAEAERAAAADAEAARWLGQITKEGEGDQAQNEAEEQNLLADFVEYITERKTVVLEDLAADFGLRVQDVISRVSSLDQSGRITGIMDDRGKFIYVSREEMEAVAGYIRQRGRVAIAELAAKSNTFIDLEQKQGADRAAAQPLELGLDDSEGEGEAAAGGGIDFDV